MHDAAADDLRRLLATLAPATRVSAGEENERRARAALADAAAGVETLDKTSLADLRDGVSARLREANAAARCAPTPDHAAVLGLRAGASSASASGLGPVADSDVKKSYHRLALKHHPDKSCAGLPGWADAEALRRDAGAVFKLVGEAHAALASAEKRRAFDAADRKARNARDDFGFSTFARDAARHAAQVPRRRRVARRRIGSGRVPARGRRAQGRRRREFLRRLVRRGQPCVRPRRVPTAEKRGRRRVQDVSVSLRREMMFVSFTYVYARRFFLRRIVDRTSSRLRRIVARSVRYSCSYISHTV